MRKPKRTIKSISVLALLATGVVAMSSPASAAAASCQHDYEIIFKMLNGTTHPRAKFCNFNCTVPNRKVTDAEVSYALDCEKLIKGRSVKADSAAHRPLGLTPASSPVPAPNRSVTSESFRDGFQKGLKEWNRKASCTSQQYKCTYIGKGQESCSWVTISTC